MVFRLNSDSQLTEREVAALLAESIRGSPTRLVHFDGEHGILRCVHTAKENVIAALNRTTKVGQADVRITTIGTSGTIRKAISKFLT